MKKHTNETLKWYLGQEVYFNGVTADAKNIPSGTYRLHTIEYDCLVELDDQSSSFRTIPACVYPILKATNDLTEEMIRELQACLSSRYRFEDFEINPDFYFSCSDEDGQPFNYIALNWLISNGYGAIPDESSPTGYSDLFGMPCVTLEQVEQGVEF